MIKFFLVTISIFLLGCAPSVKRIDYHEYPILNGPECVVYLEEPIPGFEPAGDKVGSIKIGDTGFSLNCAYGDVIKILKKEACGLQANYVLVREESREGTRGSSCYRVKADFYRMPQDYIEKLPSARAIQDDTGSERDRSLLWNILGYTIGFIAGFVIVTLFLY